jgi:hypothetical protein
MNKEKELIIKLLTEKLEKLSNQKVQLEESSKKKIVDTVTKAVKTINILRHELYTLTKDNDLFSSFDNSIEKLQNLKETPKEAKQKGEYGGKGVYELPESHVAAMKVSKGGSSCFTCKFVNAKDHKCKNSFYINWNGGKDKLPNLPLDEICSDWWEPK